MFNLSDCPTERFFYALKLQLTMRCWRSSMLLGIVLHQNPDSTQISIRDIVRQ
jgi:hypothetical protein